MTFDVSELPGRETDLYNAAKEAYEHHLRGGPGGGTTQQRETANGVLDEIIGIYNDFLYIPSPEDFSGMTGDLLQAMEQLADEGFDKGSTNDGDRLAVANSTLAQVSTSGDYLLNWTGTAAQSFKASYADKFGPMTSSQFQAYYLLRHAINAEAAVWQTVREDLDKLSANATEQMRHVRDCNQDEWLAVLKIAGAVVAVGGAVPTGGASLAGWTAVAAGVTVASTGVELAGDKGSTDEFGMANGSPKEIVDSLKEALGKIKAHITTQEGEIIESVNGAVSAINGAWNEFCLPEPALASTPHQELPGGMGNPN